ncbi:MAG: voltage-gated potassium channel [Deltaproteobacteria bacterium]|nr:MAG: voltage-gated potassium channel [Deltaproteobacteria bacterium]
MRLKTVRTNLKETISDLSRKDWFPHVPISLGVALIGLLHLIPVIDQAIGLHHHLLTPGSIRQDLEGVSLSGISQLSISILLLVMSVGLWFQLRTAWLLSVLAALIGVVKLYLLSDTTIGIWLSGFDLMMVVLLLVNYRSFERSSLRQGTWVALVAVVILFAYTVLGVYHLGDQFSPNINNMKDAIYVSVVTMSTVGFGDFTPTTPETRLFMVSIIILSITVFSTAIGATLIPAIIQKIAQLTGGGHSKMIRDNHYIIVGFSTLSSNTYRELVSRDQPVTVILRREAEGTQFSDTNIDVVVGDGGDLETLRRAGAEKAKAILALMDDDSENAFVVLAAKELKVKAKTVAAVNDAKHLNRIRHVHPDMIIAPQVLGGELLTSMLTGERIDIKNLMDRMLGLKTQPAKAAPDKVAADKVAADKTT